MTTELLTRPAQTSTDDPDKLAHYANKNQITEAHVMGTPIVALCGYVWVPSRDPQKLPVCPACAEVYETLPA